MTLSSASRVSAVDDDDAACLRTVVKSGTVADAGAALGGGVDPRPCACGTAGTAAASVAALMIGVSFVKRSVNIASVRYWAAATVAAVSAA